MREASRLVINTGPTIALVGAVGSLDILEKLYEEVIVPYEVTEELLVDNATRFGAREFREASKLTKLTESSTLSPYLANSLDRGEAAVIQVAMDRNIETVCIDEPAGRRIARLSGVRVTGSLGILIRAKGAGELNSVTEAIRAMHEQGIHLSERVMRKALEEAGEDPDRLPLS